MKNIVKRAALGLLMVPVVAFGVTAVLNPSAAFADTTAVSSIEQGIGETGVATGNTDLFGIVRNVIQILLIVIGLLSVIMLIVGGIRYVLSGGNSTAVTAAKNTILYALIGLVVAILATVIVQFVVKQLG